MYNFGKKCPEPNTAFKKKKTFNIYIAPASPGRMMWH